MDDLKTIINTLHNEDQKEFSIFIQRAKNKKNRKDAELFKLLLDKKNYTSEQLLNKLYPKEKNQVAYHALRKRLMQHLLDFIVLKRSKADTTANSSIMGLISLSHYLFEERADKLAWKIIKKAERMAVENENYDLLNNIYNLQIEYAHVSFVKDLGKIIEKRNKNKLLQDENERANIACSLIYQKLMQIRQEGKEMNFQQLIEEILEAYKLTDTFQRNPYFVYKMAVIARSAVLVKKDYYLFGPYLINLYNQTESYFKKAHHFYKITLLYMIAHVLYRNRKFEKSVLYLEKLAKELTIAQKGHWKQFYPRYVMLLSINNDFMGSNTEAINLIENLVKEFPLSKEEWLNTQMNLSFYYFQKEDYSKANQVWVQLGHTDNWLEKKMGKEWVLKKNLTEMIIQYELGNIDLVMNKIRSIGHNFDVVLKQNMYSNIRMYLHFIKKIVDDPEQVVSQKFAEEVDSGFLFLPVEQENIQAMNYYAWIKSKMLQRNYYEVLLELASLT